MAGLTDIVWSPNHEDNFCVIFKNIIFLLRISDYDGSITESGRKVKVIGGKYKFQLTLVNTCTERDVVQAFAWRPSLDTRVEGPVIPPFLVALGLSSGAVKLTSLQNVDPRQDHFSLDRKELVSHANRFSAFLHWNPWRTSLLAQGLDRGKHNRTPSVLVWDVIRETDAKELPNSGKLNSEFSGGGLPLDSVYNMDKIAGEIRVKDKESKSFCDRPLCDACLNENVVSFAWVSKNSFVVGLATRQIKLYDISDTAKTIQMTQTRLFYGLTSDPLLPTRFASFCQNQVALWTAENLEKPICVFTERKEVVCMKWSPLREGWLGVLLANSTDIRIYNALLTFSRPMDECEQFLFELRATTSTGLENSNRGTANDKMDSFVSFAWHGSIVNCIITIDSRGCLNVAKVNETTSLVWSPNHALLWCVGSGWLGIDRNGLFGARGYSTLPSSLLENQEDHAEEDEVVTSHPQTHRLLSEKLAGGIAQLAFRLDANLDSVMQKRADAGYGLKVEVTPYSVIVADNPQLRSLWIMIEYLQDCIEGWAPYGKYQEPNMGNDLRFRLGGVDSSSTGSSSQNLRCNGALTLLCGNDSADIAQLSPSTVITQADWHGIDARLPYPRYASCERSRVLRMCMWPLDAPQDVQRKVFESVCSDLEFERAAAMALINLQFDWAVSFLSRASEYRRAKEAEAATSGGPPSVVMPVSDLTASETDLIKLALSGFSDTQNDVWGSACADILSRLNNPYLRFMFRFLTTARGDFNNAPDFSEILDNESLYLIDRLTFACLYLCDEKLREYVRSVSHRMICEGRLEAILLTGLSTPQFFDLLQQYVDLTSDVQTAAILGLHACQLCRRAAPPIPSNPPNTSFMTPSTPTTGSGVSGAQNSTTTATNQNRLRLRGMREVMSSSRISLTSASGMNVTPLPADQVVAKIGGRRLVNWVETYRDMLDRWRMWYYRVDFDNHYKTRLITPLLGTPGRTMNTASGIASGAGPVVSVSFSTLSPNTAKYTSIPVSGPSKSVPLSTPIRAVGLPAGSSQIFASCAYCGWRLGGVVRGSIEDSSTTVTPTQSAAGLTSASAIPPAAAAAVAAAGAGGGATSMHFGGGKQTICWHCLKPLPRCSICLMHMGSEVGCDGVAEEVTSSRSHRKRSHKSKITRSSSSTAALKGPVAVGSGGPSAVPGVKMTRIDATKSKKPEVTGGSNDASRGGPLHLPSWFVWCQACRHGGHAGHMFEWFYGGEKSGGSAGSDRPFSPDLIECPVNGCSCHCAGLDSSIPPPRQTPSPPPADSTFLPEDVAHRDAGMMPAKMRDLQLLETSTDPASSTESEDSSGSIPFQTISRTSMPLRSAENATLGVLKRDSLTPASLPKNRREIVDPVFLAMDYRNDEDEGKTEN